MEQRNIYGNLVAAALVQTTGGGSFSGEVRGFSSVTSASSPWTLTLSNPIDAADCTIEVSIVGTSAGSASVQQTADDTIVVRTFTAAGEGGDRPFEIAVFRHGVGTGDRP